MPKTKRRSVKATRETRKRHSRTPGPGNQEFDRLFARFRELATRPRSRSISRSRSRSGSRNRTIH